jgi:predicted aspartyl protease
MKAVNCGWDGANKSHEVLVFYGPLLKVNVGFDPTWTTALNAPPKLAVNDLDALIDTGSQESCIDSMLAVQLELPLVDRQRVCGVGSMEVDVRAGQVYVPALKYTITGKFAAVPLKEHGHRQSVLLGRTFLRDCKLAYDGKTGKVTIELNL